MLSFLTGFRKLLMAMCFLVVAVILLVTKQVPSADWMKHVAEVMVAFFATNVGEHIINVGKDWIAERGKKDIKTIMDEHNAK